MKYTVLMSVLFLTGCSGVEIVGGLVLMGVQEAAEGMYEVNYTSQGVPPEPYSGADCSRPYGPGELPLACDPVAQAAAKEKARIEKEQALKEYQAENPGKTYINCRWATDNPLCQ